jgi:alkylresorcinol/alkylpyrone synthase
LYEPHDAKNIFRSLETYGLKAFTASFYHILLCLPLNCRDSMPDTTPETAKILSLATAVPAHALRQNDIRSAAEAIFGASFSDFSRFLPVYTNAAIETRYSCMPLDWYRHPTSLSERNSLYLKHAIALLEEASCKAVAQAGLRLEDIDGIIVVSNSGIATPSLDALLMETLRMKRSLQRLPVFGLGCAGGVIGLARAAQLAKGMPGKRYLYMAVELCSLNLLHSDRSKSNVIATALFGDGAAAAVISCAGEGPEVGESSEYTWPDSLGVMGWDVADEGLKAVFSQDIPCLVRQHMGGLVDAFLKMQGLTKEHITAFLCHPGGAKVLDALEDALQLPPRSLIHSRNTLRDYGNMSSATALFVLKAALRSPEPGEYMLSALGPGFTAVLLMLHIP